MAQPGKIRNTGTCCLDGPPQLALASYQSIIGHAREFCRQRGIQVDISDLFGEGTEVFTTPSTGTFYLTLKYRGRFITLVFRAKDWWLIGWFSENGSYEIILDGQDDNYMIQEDCMKLNFSGNHRVVSPAGVEATWVGQDALRDAFETFWAYKGGKEPKGMRRCYGVMVVHFAEALRLIGVYNTVCKAFIDPQVARLCSHRSDESWSNADWIRSWRFLSRQGMRYIANLKAGDPEPTFDNRGIVDITSIVAVLHEIRVFYIGAFSEGPFHHEHVPNSLVYAEPIDPGEGDPEINLTVNSDPTRVHKRKRSESSEKNENKKARHKVNKKRKKGTDSLESVRRKRYLGGGVGGPPANFPPSILLPCLPLPKQVCQGTASNNGNRGSVQEQNTSNASAVNVLSSISGQKRHLSTAFTLRIAPNASFSSVDNLFSSTAGQRNFFATLSSCTLPIVPNSSCTSMINTFLSTTGQSKSFCTTVPCDTSLIILLGNCQRYRQNQFCSVNGKMLSASTRAFKREVYRFGCQTRNHKQFNRNWLTTTYNPKVLTNIENIFRRQVSRFGCQTGTHEQMNCHGNWLAITQNPKNVTNIENIFRREVNRLAYVTRKHDQSKCKRNQVNPTIMLRNSGNISPSRLNGSGFQEGRVYQPQRNYLRTINNSKLPMNIQNALKKGTGLCLSESCWNFFKFVRRTVR